MFRLGKKSGVFAVLLCCMLLFAACAPAAQSGTSSSSAGASSASTAAEGTKIVSTVKGDVEVPLNPQRVISTYGMGDVLALGVMPVATYDVAGTAYAEKVASLPVWSAFEAEEILSYEPDLILVVNDDQYDEVSKIAPTVMVPFTQMTMRERVTFLGEVLGKEAEAEKALADFEEKIASSKQQLEEKGIMDKTFSLFEHSSSGGVWVYGDKWGRGGDLLYSHMGFLAPEVVQNEIIGKDQYRDVSLEAMGDYAGDYIVFCGELNDLEGNPVWESIPAVKAGHIIPIDLSLFYDIDIFSSNVQLDYLMEHLIEISE